MNSVEAGFPQLVLAAALVVGRLVAVVLIVAFVAAFFVLRRRIPYRAVLLVLGERFSNWERETLELESPRSSPALELSAAGAGD